MDPTSRADVTKDLMEQSEGGALKPAKRSALLGASARGLTAEDLEEDL